MAKAYDVNFGLLHILEISCVNSTHSVSPSPKKGHGKVAKKGHFQRAAACQKGTFSARRQAKGHLFK